MGSNMHRPCLSLTAHATIPRSSHRIFTTRRSVTCKLSSRRRVYLYGASADAALIREQARVVRGTLGLGRTMMSAWVWIAIGASFVALFSWYAWTTK